MKLFFMTLGLLACSYTANVYAYCSDQLVTALFTQLSPYLSWVDINPKSGTGVCNLTIRYYPCVSDMRALFANAIKKLPFRCGVTYGVPVKIEGYCALRDNLLNCTIKE